MRRTLGKLCASKGVSPGTVLPGCPASEDVESAHACMASRVACRACVAADRAGALAAPCDDLDDGQPNGSCPL